MLHYMYGMASYENEKANGVSGIIVSESHYDENAVCILKVDKEYKKTIKMECQKFLKTMKLN